MIRTVTGAKLILETLNNFGVDTVFGYPGGIVLKLYDELYNQTAIKHVLVRHEQSAVHAAEGYARVTGKTGVVFVTSGPGATNTVTGIANAFLDGFPLVVITGQVNSDLIGKNAFQEADICSITKACTKSVYQVKSIKTLQKTLYDAFMTANSDRKGPVVIDIAKDVFSDETEISLSKQIISDNIREADVNVIKDVLNLFNGAKLPLIVTGGGAVDTYIQVRKLSEMLNIPVVTTMMGIGTFPADDINYLGMVGIFGQKSANEAIKNSDLILSLGARFNDRITCCFSDCDLDSKIIQCDVNPEEFNKNFKAKYTVNCDCKSFLTALLNEIKSCNSQTSELLKLKQLNSGNVPVSNALQSFEVIEVLNDFIKGKDLYVTTEVGQHQLWAVKGLDFSMPKHFITSGGSGTMGFGLPAAIGIAVADNSKPVVCISGDGSLQMSLHELATCRDYNLPIKIILLNNGYLGMVRQLQEKQFEGRYSQTKISNPDFEKIAEAYGIGYQKVFIKDSILPALQKEFSHNKTSVIEFVVEPYEIV